MSSESSSKSSSGSPSSGGSSSSSSSSSLSSTRKSSTSAWSSNESAFAAQKMQPIESQPLPPIDEPQLSPELKQKSAKEFYKQRDAAASKTIHEYGIVGAPEKHRKSGEYVKSMVFGAMDGIITTFAVVAGVAGSNLTTGVVLILGFANLFADGISMGLGDFLSEQAEHDYVLAEKARERWETQNYLEGEKREMVEIYEGKGLSHDDAVAVIDILSKYEDHFVNVMLVEELGLMPPDPDAKAWKNGLITFVGFLIFGLIPLISYVIGHVVNGGKTTNGVDIPFVVACVATGIALFVLGAAKSRFSNQRWWISGFLVLFTGAVAAVAAYFVGAILKLILGDAANC